MTTPTPLAKLAFIFLILLSFNGYAQVPTNADCLGAIPVCQTVYSFNSSVHGTGNYTDIPVMGGASEDHCPGNCISAGEQNTTWFIFTTQTAGLLNFTISPVSGSDDYDWAVFNMTTNGCSDIYNGGMQVSCNYCLNTGPTGPNGGTGYACWGPNSCSQYNAPIPVGANQTYVLMVDNFSSSNNGYTLDFSASSAQIFDNVPPTLTSVQTPVLCGASTLNIAFSENILCSSISPSDFTVTGPGGPYTVTYVSGAACNVGGTLENTFALTVVPNMSGSGTYTLSLTNAAGSVTDACANVAPTHNINFTISGPNVSVTPSTPSYCGSGSVNMTASGATTYLWTPSTGLSSTSSATVTASPSATTTYTIYGSTAGCTDVETATVTVNPSPVISFSQSPAGAQCTGTTVTVTASSNIPGSSFVWSTGGNTSSITVTPASTTTYTVTATSPVSCTSTAAYTVTINPLPVVNLTPFTAACANGASFTLSNGTPAGGTYSGTGVSGGTFNPAVSGAGVFPITYTYTNGNGCTNTDVENITVNSAPVVSFATLNQVCINTPSFALTGGSPAGGVYSGTGVSSGNFNPATAGAGTHTITYTYTNSNNCTGTATQTITVNALPVVSLSPFSAVCTNTPTFALSGGSPAGGVYSGTGVSAGNFNPATAGAGTHTITYTYTNANSCTNSTTQNITVNTPPTATFTVSPLNGCDMVPVTATYGGNGGSGATFNWDFDGGTASPGTGAGPHSITFPSQGSYDVSLTVTENGCTSAPYQVAVAIGGVDATAAVVHDALCYGQSNGEATVNTNGGTSPFAYVWNTSPAQSAQNAINLAAGSYVVTVTDDHGCTDVDSVTINEPPVLLAHISDSSIVSCFGGNDGMDSVTVSGGTPPYYYAWASSTSSSPYATGFSAGVYTVTVTDDKGCNVIIPFMVYQNPEIQLAIDAVNEGCENSCTGSATATVSGGISPYTYLWSLGAASTQGINNLCAGDYSITVTDSKNCTVTETVNIATNTYIHADGSASPVEGQGPLTVNFFFTGSGASGYMWDFGDGLGTSSDVNPSYTYTHEGVYTVVLTVNSGNPDHCSDTYTVQITVHAPSVIEIPNVFTPNNDLANDVFTVKSEGLQTEKMVIYNRWGKEVYEWNEVHGKWDGIARSGQEASDGEYYFIFDAAGYDGQEYHVSGSVTLMR